MITSETKQPSLTILCFVGYYLPGYKSGGPVRTISNMVEHLGKEFNFNIVTRDHDLLNTESYNNVLIDNWNTVGNSKVYYLSKKTITLYRLILFLKNSRYDVLYLNSLFDVKFTILPLLILWFGLASRKVTVLAPRGELSLGAMSLGRFKKKFFLFFFKNLGLYKNVHWQASSILEKKDIERELAGLSPRVSIAQDLPSKLRPQQRVKNFDSIKRNGQLQVIFLSRITPIKNLDYLLSVLKVVCSPVKLSIFGPIEDANYWRKCKSIIKELPVNITVCYKGDVKPKHVHTTFSKYDVFAFPTRGENFGHVIFESLSAGTPVIISNKTPWQKDAGSAITVISLNNHNDWVRKIENLAQLNEQSFDKIRKNSLLYASSYILNNKSVERNRQLFLGGE
jgi:glycosyltransferase involved in cell wall biosynthesis